MRAKKTQHAEPKRTGEQIVQKKLDTINELLRNTDLSKLLNRRPTKQD